MLRDAEAVSWQDSVSKKEIAEIPAPVQKTRFQAGGFQYGKETTSPRPIKEENWERAWY